MSTQKTTYSSEREIAEIWRLHREEKRERKARFKEMDRKMEEVNKLIRENAQQMKETDWQMQETDRKINKVSGDWARKWGQLVESLVEGSLVKILNERNIDVKGTAERVKGPRLCK